MDNSKATTGGEGLLKHDQNSSAPEKLKSIVGSDAAEHLTKAETWAQITNENSHLLPALHKDGNKHQDKLPYLELLCYEIAAQHLINAIANSSKQLTGQEMFRQPGPNLARLFKHMGESTEQLKSFDSDKEVNPKALNHVSPETKTDKAQIGAANPFLLFNQVSLKENAVVDGAGKKALSEPLAVKPSNVEPTQQNQAGLVNSEHGAVGSTGGGKAAILPEVTLAPLSVSKTTHSASAPSSEGTAPVIALSQLLVSNPDNVVKNVMLAAPSAPEQGAIGDVKVAAVHAPEHQGSKVESNQPVVASLKSESTLATASTSGAQAESAPVLVVATKLANPFPAATTPVLRTEGAPVLIAATKLDSLTTIAPTAGMQGEVTPVLVAAAKLDTHAPVKPSVGAPVEIAPAPVAANPFMSIKQVAVRDEAVIDGSGKVVVNEPVASHLPVVVARVAPDSSMAIALTANSQSDKALVVNPHTVTVLAVTDTTAARSLVGNGDSNTRPPVIVASQLVVKDPVSRGEVSTPSTPASLPAPGSDGAAPAHTPINRLDHPVLVAATKVEDQHPAPQAPAVRVESTPVLVAATKVEATAPAAQAPAPKVEGAPVLAAATKVEAQNPAAQAPASKVEGAPVLVAAAKSEPGATTVNRVEATQLQPSPVAQTVTQAITSVAKAEPAPSQSVAVNPFQSIKQVVVRDEAVIDGSGKVVVNEAVASPAPIVGVRVAPENSIANATPATTNPFAVATSTTLAKSAVDNGDINNRPPVVVASQLLVKDPIIRNEAITPVKPALIQSPAIDSTTTAQIPANRLDNPVLVAATKVEAQHPAPQAPAVRVESTPVLVAATKVEAPAPAAQAPAPKVEGAPVLAAATKVEAQNPAAQAPALKVEGAPVLVAAAKSEPGTTTVNRVEATQLQPSPVAQTVAQTITSVAKAEPAPSQSVAVNPFQSIKQVVVRDEAVIDGSGKVVVNESVTSPAPIVGVRIAPENSIANATPAATNPFAVATSTTLAKSTVDNGDINNRPPVVVASQLLVKDPIIRNEVSTPAKTTSVQTPVIESTAPVPVSAPTNRSDNPVLVAAAKLETQTPVVPAPTNRSDNPVLVAATKLETQTPAAPAPTNRSDNPVLVAATKLETQAPAAPAPTNRTDNPVLVAAAKLETQTPAAPAPTNRTDNPVLVAATKLETPAPAAITPAVRGENAPVLVAANKVEPVANPANRGEVPLSQPCPTANAVASVTKAEPAVAQPLLTSPLPANPFQSIKQVAARDEAVIDGAGKVVVSEPVASQAPVVSARVAPENPANTAAPAAFNPSIVNTNPVTTSATTLARSVVDSGDNNNRPPVISASQLLVKDPAIRNETVSPVQVASTGSKSDIALPVVRVNGPDSLPTANNPVVQDGTKPQTVPFNPFQGYTNVLARVESVSDNGGKKVIAETIAPSAQPTEAPKPQPAPVNQFQGYTNVLARVDSVSDNGGKKVIAETVTPSAQPNNTTKPLSVSPTNEVAAVKPAINENREVVLARNSTPVVVASQLVVKDAGGQSKTEGQTRIDSPVRTEVLVKAEPVVRAEPGIKLTENIKGGMPLVPTQSVGKTEAVSVPTQSVSKTEAVSVPTQSVNKTEAVNVPVQPGNKSEGLVSSTTLGISAPALSIAGVPVTKQVDKQSGVEALAATNTLEGLFEAVGRSRAVTMGDILTAKTSATIEPTSLKTAAEAKVAADNIVPGAKSVANASMPNRVSNPEFQIVDSRAGLTIASADAALTGSSLSPALHGGLPASAATTKTEGASVKTDSQNAVLDVKTPVRPGLKEGEGTAIAGAAIVNGTSRNAASGGGTSTAPSTKSGVAGGVGTGTAPTGATPTGTAPSGTVNSGNTTTGAAAVNPTAGTANASTNAGTSAGTTGHTASVSGASSVGAPTAAATPTPSNSSAVTGTGVSTGLVTGQGGGNGIAGATGGATGATGGVNSGVGAVVSGAGGVVVTGGAPAGQSGVSVVATTAPATNDPSATSNFNDPITAISNQNGLTIDPTTLQPLTLVDGEEVLDGRHKGDTLASRGPGKKNKAEETTKEPESDRAGAAKSHGYGSGKNGKVRPQAADDVALSLAELERQKRAEAEKRRKLQEKARKQKAEPPRQVEKQRRCHILKGDTLESLALQYLGASNLATLIYKINQGFWWERRHANKIYLELLPGTVIFLPTTGEIAQFREKLSCGKVKLLHFEYLSCEHVRSLRQLLAGARDKKAVIDQSANIEQQSETIAQEEVTANLPESAAVTVAVAPMAGTYVAFAANCDKKPTPLAATFAASQTGRLLIPGQVVVSDRLEEQSRVVEINNQQQSDSEYCQVQLQVWYSGQWLVVMEYVSSNEPVLNVHSLSGAKREIKILLPASAVKSMALNDLTSNRMEYARKFLLGRKILL